MQQSPRIAIALGDPVGIGPEVVAKALTNPEVIEMARLVVVGSPAVMDKAFALIGSGLRSRAATSPDETVSNGTVPVLGEAGDGLDSLTYGRVSARAGNAAVSWLRQAAGFAMKGQVDAIVTAPINKEAASLAGYDALGHQEIYQSMTGAEHVVTMLMTPGLRVVHLTTHKPLRLVHQDVTKANILAKLRLTHEFFTRYGIPRPRIGVAALNPHAGDGGLIGSEEANEIAPAVDLARAEGIDATGPVPADSIFNQAIAGQYDVVLAMYHDQGHIAIKVHDWHSSVSINLGLPFLRVSVDHGTAFDIAGRGIADPAGMFHAIRCAATVARGSLRTP